jgi:hypothetical protein
VSSSQQEVGISLDGYRALEDDYPIAAVAADGATIYHRSNVLLEYCGAILLGQKSDGNQIYVIYCRSGLVQ